MLIPQSHTQYNETIDCSQIKPFPSLAEAQLYVKLKAPGFMITKEQDKDIWYVMPNYNGVLVGGCYEEE